MKTEDRIILGHGGGGRLSRDLIDREILSRFKSKMLGELPDAARLPSVRSEIIYSTDSFVVKPVFFPGGNIGDLAVHGTVNDISVAGGRPLYLSLGLIIEDGLLMTDLRKILDSIKNAAVKCGVQIVTGDTKVVEKGQADGIYINTSGIGSAIKGFLLGTDRIKAGDKVIVSGTIAEHGFAVLSARKNIDINDGPKSDSAPVHRIVEALKPFASEIKFMRDPTRGGMAAVLNEIADGRRFGISIQEQLIPMSPAVKAVSEMLGIDPLHVASEGKLLSVCSGRAAGKCLKAMRSTKEGRKAEIIGTVTDAKGIVTLETLAGGTRLIDLPRGELLPRIC